MCIATREAEGNLVSTASWTESDATSDLLDAVTLMLAAFDVSRVMFIADVSRDAPCRVRGSFSRWVIALHALVREAVAASPPGEIVLVAIMASEDSVRVLVRERGGEHCPVDIEAAVEDPAVDSVRDLAQAAGGWLTIHQDPESASTTTRLVIPLDPPLERSLGQAA
ncbi:MAG: hypothetical protein U0414_17700 [Polyangiaceae bacterium]